MGRINYQAIYEKNKHDWYALTEEPQKYEALLAGHYSDSNHFVYELLQNAEDEKASKVVVEYYRDQLVFYHNGDSFDEGDVRGVSSMLMGTKNKDDASTIGKFGMGFKSVFKYTYQPEIYSDEEGFVIQDYLLPKEVKNGWDYQKAKTELKYPDGDKLIYAFAGCKHLTKIVIPFKKKDQKGSFVTVDGKDVLDKLQSLSGEILLFLTYIQDLYWINKETGKYAHITLGKDEKDQNLITCRISGNNGDGKEEITRYLKYRDVFDHPDMKNAEVSVAYKVNNQAKNVNELKGSPVWVYFPTRDNTDLPFLIHGSFETAVSREKLMTPSDFNNVLFDRLGTLIADTMEDLGKRGLITRPFIRRVILAAFQDEIDNGTIPGLTEKVTEAFRTKALVPETTGHGRMASELRIPVPFSLAEQANSVLWIDVFEGVENFVALNNERESRFTEYYSWLRDDLKIPVFNLRDWAQKLCEQPERVVSTTDGTLDELKSFYNFISDYQEEYYKNERTYSRAGAYEATIRGCLPEAWEYLREAPIVLNAENRMIPAYKDDVLQVYLSSSSKYRTILSSNIVSNLITKDYRNLLEDSLKIAVFDNYQFVKEKVIKKYVEGKNGRIGFQNIDDFDQEYTEDLKQIFSLFEEVGDVNEVKEMLKDADIIKVISDDGEDTFARPSLVYVDRSDEGMDLSVYFHPITIAEEEWVDCDEDYKTIYVDTGRVDDFSLYHLDTKYYEEKGIALSQLKKLGLITSPIDEGRRWERGYGDNYWDALGEFCPWIRIRNLKDNLEYIKTHAESDLAKKKSAEILKLFLQISRKLKGNIRRRQRSPYTKEEKAGVLDELNRHDWLFDKDGKLHSPNELSRYDLDKEIYDDLPINKQAFGLLGFVEKESDVKAETFEKVQALNKTDKRTVFLQLAGELGYDLASLVQAPAQEEEFTYGDEEDSKETFNPSEWMSDEFPQHRVRDRENLLAHVRQQFFFADPVKYEKVMRQIRKSKSQKAVRAYTVGMYINESDINICQMCMKPSKHVDAIEIANFGIEMPQLHLSLCPDCARRYKDFRDASKEHFKSEMSRAIREIDAETIEDDYEIKIPGGTSVHFTQTHIAEVKEILNLLDEYGVPGDQSAAEINIVTQDTTPVQIVQPSHIEKVTAGKVIVSRANIPGSENRLEISRNYQRPQQRSETPSNNVSTPKANVLGKTDDNYPKEGGFVKSQRFGQGTIVKVDTKYLEVEFSFYGKKRFAMPTCFETGFLKYKPNVDFRHLERTEENSITKEKKVDLLSLAEFFATSGFEVVDKRANGGALWVVGTRQELEDSVKKAERLFNAKGTYCNGGRAVGYRKAWFTKCKQ